MGSTIVRTQPGQPAAHTLSLLTAVALFDTIQELLPTPHRLVLKWPNDLLIGDAKLSGILLEAERDAVVIGIGVNLVSAPDLADRNSDLRLIVTPLQRASPRISRPSWNAVGPTASSR